MKSTYECRITKICNAVIFFVRYAINNLISKSLLLVSYVIQNLDTVKMYYNQIVINYS